MKHPGSCHCGKIAFEVDGETDNAVACNCSICQRKGSLLWFVPRSALHPLTPDANAARAARHTFNRHAIRHRFCPVCGMPPYGEGRDRDGNAMAAINLRCLEGIDLAAIPAEHVDGRAY